MMALEFQAEHNLFACVEQDAYKVPAASRFLNREESVAFDWLRRFNPGFWCSAEDNKSLVAMHRLAMELESLPSHANYGGFNNGIYVVFAHNWGDSRFDTFDKIADMYLPNARKRLCTQLLKVYPIYRYCLAEIIQRWKTGNENALPVEMRIGLRLDELDRTVNLYFRTVERKNRQADPGADLQAIIDKYRIPDYITNWWDRMGVEKMLKSGERVLKNNPFNEYDGDYYRIPSFPLIKAGITKGEVVKYWKGKPEYKFPAISNCVMCFHHRINQLQKQWQDPQNIAKMQWAADAEMKKGRTFLKNMTMDDIKNMAIQTEIDFSDFPGCDSGACTD